MDDFEGDDFDTKIRKIGKLGKGKEMGQVKVFDLADLLDHGVTKEELIDAQSNANGDKVNKGYYFIDMLLINGTFLSYSMQSCGIALLNSEVINEGFWENVGKIVVMW